ncbi:hypothetical protein FO519_008357 [Halicephalobus sp. NKZ332]|nr:hypothetical protein FO519_008357 [Halicephalobus sp. NKZ332]
MVSISIGILFLIFMACLSSVVGFTCGAGRFDTWIVKSVIVTDCKSRLSQFSSCCIDHDKCYDEQAGRRECDTIFCGCLNRAARRIPACQAYVGEFCFVIRTFGSIAYKKAGK